MGLMFDLHKEQAFRRGSGGEAESLEALSLLLPHAY